MSSVDFIGLVKEVGAVGIAIYAWYVMNGLSKAIDALTLQVAMCPKKVKE